MIIALLTPYVPRGNKGGKRRRVASLPLGNVNSLLLLSFLDSDRDIGHQMEIIGNVNSTIIIILPPQRGYISFVNTFVTPRNNDLGPYVPWRHLISAKF